MTTYRTSIRTCLLATVAGLTTFSLAMPAWSTSMLDAVKTAVQSYPSIEEASSNRRAQDYELKQQRGLYLPSLDVSSGAGPEWTKGQTATKGKDMPRYDNRATLSVLLFDGFGRESAIERSASRVDAAANRVMERSEAIAAAAIEAYLDVLRNIEIVRLGEENVATHADLVEKVRQRYAGGQSGAGDLQQARSRFSAARENVIQARKDLVDSRTNYINLINMEPDGLEPSDPLESALPATLDEAVNLALDHSPTILAASADLDEANAAHRGAASNYWPKLSLEGTGGYNRNADGIRGEDRDASLMVKMSYNLYRGGIDQNRRMEMAERSGEARAAVMRLERAVTKEVRDSWSAMETAKSRAVVLNEQVLANAEVVVNYRQGFDIGQRDLLDLLDAENELYTSRVRSTTANYTHEYAIYRTLASMGTLTSALGVPVPAESMAAARERAGVETERTAPFINREQRQKAAPGTTAAP